MESKLDAMFNQWLKVRVSFKTEAEALKAVESNGYALRYVKDQMFEHLLNQTPTRIITKAEIAEKFGVSEFEILA